MPREHLKPAVCVAVSVRIFCAVRSAWLWSLRALLLPVACWLGLAGCALAPLAAPTAPAIATATPAGPVAVAAAPTPVQVKNAGLLQKVKRRGALYCGVDESLPGFSTRRSGGQGSDTFEGFNADFCRVVAAAIFEDPTDRVVFFPLSFDERYPALLTGRVDLLFGNTSWIASVDAELPLDFGPTTFYDSLAVMAPESLGIVGWEDLSRLNRAGTTVCVEPSGFPVTRVEQGGIDAGPAPAIVDLFAENGISLQVRALRSDDYSYDDYLNQECDAVVALQSRLYSRRSAFVGPARNDPIVQVAFAIPGQQLPRLVREPLGPVFLEGDNQWRDLISWSVYATIQAEEYGITQDNLKNFLERPERSYRIFLGQEGALGRSLGLQPDFARRIVEEVGSYVEIYNANLRSILPERGPNKAWNRTEGPAGEVGGGVLSSPPFR